MRLWVAAVLLGWLSSGALGQPVALHVRPGGAGVIDSASGRLLARAPLEADSAYRWDADTDKPLSIMVQRPPYDDVALILTWEPTVHRWQFWFDGKRRLLNDGWRLDD